MFIVFALFNWLNLFLVVSFAFLFLASQGFIFPNATALALAPLGHNAGNASALIGAIQMTIGASVSAIVSVFQNHTALPMALVMTCCAVAALVAFIIGKKRIAKQVTNQSMKEEDIEMISTL